MVLFKYLDGHLVPKITGKLLKYKTESLCCMCKWSLTQPDIALDG